jgi:hypothetical protein
MAFRPTFKKPLRPIPIRLIIRPDNTLIRPKPIRLKTPRKSMFQFKREPVNLGLPLIQDKSGMFIIPDTPPVLIPIRYDSSALQSSPDHLMSCSNNLKTLFGYNQDFSNGMGKHD